MAAQTSLALTAIGQPLRKLSFPIPEPKENELLVKVTVAGLNPIDQKFRDYNILNISSRLPTVLGGDIVGTVVSAGSKATTFPIGSRVFSQAQMGSGAAGGLQEYTVIDARFTSLVPQSITNDEAAIFPVNAFTSALGLFGSSGLGIPFPGSKESRSFGYAVQKIVIIGGGTNCGKLAIQFARLAGIGTIVAVASPSGASELESYGATHVISRHADDIEKQVRDVVGDELIYVYDTFNSGDLTLGVSLLSNSEKGTSVTLLSGEVHEDRIGAKKAGYETKHIVGASQLVPEFGLLFWSEFPKWLEAGDIKPLRYSVIDGLDEIKVNQALDDFREGKNSGHWHVHISGVNAEV